MPVRNYPFSIIRPGDIARPYLPLTILNPDTDKQMKVYALVKNQSTCDRIIFSGIAALLIFAPLAFGSVHVWAYSLIELGVFFLLALWFADRLLFSRRDAIEWVKTPVNLFLVLLLFLIGLQMAPLPSSLISFLSPQTFADKMQLFEVMAKTKDFGLDGSRWTCLAYYLHPAITEWLKLATYMGMFFLVLNSIRSKRQINILIYILILIGLFEALYAIFQVFSDAPMVWWWKSRFGSGGRASGTFIGSNHFAGYMEMLIPLIFGFMLAQKRQKTEVRNQKPEDRGQGDGWMNRMIPAGLDGKKRGRRTEVRGQRTESVRRAEGEKSRRLEGEKSRSRRSKGIIQGFRDKGSEVDPQITQIDADYEKEEKSVGRQITRIRKKGIGIQKFGDLGIEGGKGQRTVRQWVVSWFSPESAQPKVIFLFFVGITMALALLLSGSRGGILFLAGAMFLMSVLFFTKRGFRRYGIAAAGFCLISFAYGLHIGIDKTLERFEQTKGLDSRLFITKTIMPMLWDYPAVGVGWGNFRYLYPKYIKDHDRVSGCGYAHNDWIEAGTEVGLAGGILIVIVFARYLVRMIRVWNRRKDHYALGIGCGVMAGLISLGFHSYFDFNMHIPANPLTLAALLAIGYAAVHRQGRGHGEKFFYRVRRIPLTRVRRVVLASMVLAAFVVSVSITGRHFLAEAKCATEWNSTMNLNWKPYLSDIKEAIDYNPGNAEYHFKLAGYYMSARAEDEVLRNAYNEQAIASLERAVRLNPARGIYWYNLGKRYSFKSYDPYGYVNKWLSLAEECFDVGIKCAPMDANMLFDVAWYWVWRASMLPEAGGQGAEDRDQRSEVGGQRTEKRDGWMNRMIPAGLDGEKRGRRTEVRGQKIKDQDGWMNGRLSSEGMKINVGIKANKTNAGMLEGESKEEAQSSKLKAQRNGRILFREDGVRKFQELFRRSLDINPRRWKEAEERVREYFPDVTELTYRG